MENQFLKEISKHLISTDGQSFSVPIGGSLGLLALGDVGLAAWRQAKLAYLQQQNIPSTQASNATDSNDEQA